ncbi:hypothetical protein E0Z10_g10570 [Xylaria hypoxylon]|uniref:Uncharacterized protein n=1 Tax=Xylaria hypoxylon TaxID=37992 RepID=A0A4Z0YNG8_9PEZI|nr:hypothetical protein E0Z10_g10570 [Xylaria hypoxylon]
MSVTVTWESVFCTVTASSSAGPNQRRDEGCSTQVFSTITACSATASTFTSTTTVSPAQPTQRGCSPKTCGATCNAKRDLLKRAVPRSTEPGVCQWAGPENYEHPKDFMASEGNLGFSNAPGTENSKIVPLPLDGKTSSEVIGFFDKPVSLAIPHLIGCTSIIVVSQKGAWASHIWEQPVFRPEEEEDEETGQITYALPGTEDFTPDFPGAQQLAFFQQEALAKLHNTYNPVTPEHQFGLDQLQNSGTPEDESWQGHLFDSDSALQVFAFIPYVAIYDEDDPNYNKENPQNLPAAWDRHDLSNPRADQDGDTFNDQINAELKNIFGQSDLPIQRVLYAPDVADDPLDDGFLSYRGRALIQYQPADSNSCDSKASWRIWFEGQVDTPTDEKEWNPLDERGDQGPAQFCDGSGNESGGAQKRQACPITTPSDSPTPSQTPQSSSSILPSTTISQTPSETPISTSTLTPSETPILTSTPAPTSTPVAGDPACQTFTFASTTAVQCS